MRHANSLWDQVSADPEAWRKYNRSFNDVFQLAHIARPVIVLKQAERLRREL